MVVDELSLVRDEPVRVKVNCWDPSTIRCVIEIFFNKTGHDVKFIASGVSAKYQETKGGPPGPGGRERTSQEGKTSGI